MAAVVESLPAMHETHEMRVLARGWEDPLEEDMATHCTALACRIRDRGAWWATVHRVARSQTRLKQLRTRRRRVRRKKTYKTRA